MQTGFGIRIYGKIISVNLKHHFRLPFLVAVSAAIVTPVLFNVNALTEIEAAKPIEFWLCLLGAILLVPVFSPEQDENVRDVICAKRFDYGRLCIMRVLYAFLTLVLLMAICVGVMKLCESDVRIYHIIGGTSSALFLGAVGFTVAGMAGNAIAGYMASMLYYLANYGLKERLGLFFLFPMSHGEKSQNAGWLFAGALVLMISTICLIKYRHQGVGLRIKYGDE